MLKLKIIIPVIVLVLFTLVVLQNSQTVTLSIFFWKVSTSQAILAPLILATGFVVGFIVAKLTGRRRR